MTTALVGARNGGLEDWKIGMKGRKETYQLEGNRSVCKWDARCGRDSAIEIEHTHTQYGAVAPFEERGGK